MPKLEIQERQLLGLTFKQIVGDPDAPSILLLHGYGANENDLLSLSQSCIGTTCRPHFYFPRAPLEVPIAPGFYGYGWFPLNIEHIKAAMYEHRPQDILKAFEEFSIVRKQCESLIDELNIPLSKLFIGGFSQGAILATDIAMHARENVAGLLIFSGILISSTNWKKMASKHKGQLFFQSHGRRDSLLPYSQAEALNKLFLEQGFQGEFHPFEGGHEISHSTILKLNSFFKKYI